MSQSKIPHVSVWGRLGRYLFRRFLVLLITLAVGVFAAVVVANLGGFVDNIARANIDETLNGMSMGGWLKDESPEDKERIFEETRTQMEEAAGLYQPFLLRCLRWTYTALTFQWTSREVWDALPYTLLLFGIAVVIIFLASLFVSLALSLRYGSWLDRLMVVLSPISAAPSWVQGIVLVVIFAAGLHWLPYGRVYDIDIPESRVAYVLMVIKHLVLPVTAIFLSAFFNLAYTWRTFFLIHSGEDYVDVARAKGLPDRMIEQRYILRPTLPFVITNYALMVIGFWQTSIALEVFFDWPGIGPMYITAIGMRYQQHMVMGILTLFAYLLAVSFFLLDVVYLMVDPRVGMEQQQARVTLPTWRGGRAGWRDLRQRLATWRLPKLELDLSGWLEALSNALRSLEGSLKELRRYPSAVVGGVIIAGLLWISLFTVLAYPYDEIVPYWRTSIVEDLPKNAQPAWTNFFRREKLPEMILLDSRTSTGLKQVTELENGTKQVTLSYVFDYPYEGFPQDIVLDFNASFREKRPFIILNWVAPNGRTTEIGSFSAAPEESYSLLLDKKLPRKLRSDTPLETLFTDVAYSLVKARPGRYELRVTAMLFEPDADLEGRFKLYGQVYGLAGTDYRRRDLLLGLLWGTPAALGVGLGGAVITSLASMLLAAVGVWYGGWLDSFVQRLAEVNLTLPMLPIGIMVYYLYSKNIWVILLVIVAFTVFGSPVKTYRSAFLQVKQLPYVEAAQAYGAGNGRIIRTYLVPRILPVLVPQLVTMIPGFVFLEATLAMLGVTDLYMPTWGKIIYDAMINGAWRGYYYWMLEPLALLLLTGMAFALVGFALDRILNPRLREI